MKKKSIILSSVAMLVVVAIGITVYFIGKDNDTPVEPLTSASSSTSTTKESITTESSTESTSAKETTTQKSSTPTTTKKSTSGNETTTKKPSGSFSKCNHPAADSSPNSLYLKGKDHKAGFENRGVMFRGCEEEQWVVWECEVCGAYPIIYEVLDAPGHDYNANEALIKYPSLGKDGYYGIRCQHFDCDEVKTTKTLPARTGSYSTVDSRFTISVLPHNNSEIYHAKNLGIMVRDERTFGAVPTITYNDGLFTIVFEAKNVGMCTYSINIDKSKIEQGYRFGMRLTDNGEKDVYYSKDYLY